MPDNIPCYKAISEFPYQEFMDGHYNDLDTVRQIGMLQVLSASQGGTLLLFVVEHDIHLVRRCEYETLANYKRDIEMWRRLPPNGDEEAGMGAKIVSLPPSLAAGNTRPYTPNAENGARDVD